MNKDNFINRVIWLTFILLLSNVIDAAERPDTIELSRTINEPLKDVWKSWTTNQGIRTFWAKDGIIEAKTHGRLDIWFFPHREPGFRGAEGMQILAFEPMHRLAFTWNAPRSFPDQREQLTFVEVIFSPVNSNSTIVTLRHMGWGEGKDWHAVQGYFQKAWNVVLNRLVKSFSQGPKQWDK